MIFSFLFIIYYNYLHLTDDPYNKYRLILLYTCHKMFLIVGENSPTFPIAAYLRPLRLGRYFQKLYIKWPPTSSNRLFIFPIDQEITTLTSPPWTIIIKTSTQNSSPTSPTLSIIFQQRPTKLSEVIDHLLKPVPKNPTTLIVTIDYVGEVGLSEKFFFKYHFLKWPGCIG